MLKKHIVDRMNSLRYQLKAEYGRLETHTIPYPLGILLSIHHSL
jgi:hypothetical protein